MQAAGTEVMQRITDVVDALKEKDGALLPILHGIQDEFGYVPDESVPVIADALNLSRADVHGVVTFYHDYRKHPAGRHVLKICRAEACQALGGQALAERAMALLGIGFHETTTDNAFTLEPTFCLGLCACAPAAMLDNQLIARFDETKLAEIVKEIRS
ncbi:formate dehydrogenase subunit gamma [Tianweitania sp. BSSL-BM11]|uniref:Formate dehydrogenase subunit gamma n=1 Tax=Tianweitania aestuarii TaxID=2814886 RepID=A0ABS5RXZ3_9HYPH|nr:formate dehydrogenase subunit gamma [Tianweitania aestuarii]MBS9721913.1 formate dehydrogenase subunit gamma [Tianweitania aestuarii]